jgi:aldose sugar dehydrogenase
MQEGEHMQPPGHQQPGHNKKHKSPAWLSWLYIAAIIFVAALAFAAVWVVAQQTNQQNTNTQQNQPTYTPPAKSTEQPALKTEVVLSGLDHVWEVAFLPTKEMLFTERSGMLSMLKDGTRTDLINVADAKARGEGGLLGLAVDPDFTNNHFIYTCFNSSANKDVRVVRWKLKTDLSGAESSSPIVTGMPVNTSGRHSGCRLAFGTDGNLWVGTGDTAQGDTSIQPKSLGGKVLRVDRDGNAAADNLGGEYDSRIYSYGHRNVQGLAFYRNPIDGVRGVSIEHGSDVDDEVNMLVKGNFGWAPAASGYNETGVPMTDKNRFPDAIDAIWSSGSPTQAPSGATFVYGRQWKAWDGALAVAMLKGEHLKFLTIDNNKVTGEVKVLEGTFGRIRAAMQGPDGDLYISTDNGDDDKIVRIIPQ